MVEIGDFEFYGDEGAEDRARELIKQRDELLEALQAAKATFDSIEDDVMSLEFATVRWRAGQGARDARAAIYRALGENKE